MSAYLITARTPRSCPVCAAVSVTERGCNVCQRNHTQHTHTHTEGGEGRERERERERALLTALSSVWVKYRWQGRLYLPPLLSILRWGMTSACCMHALLEDAETTSTHLASIRYTYMCMYICVCVFPLYPHTFVSTCTVRNRHLLRKCIFAAQYLWERGTSGNVRC